MTNDTGEKATPLYSDLHLKK